MEVTNESLLVRLSECRFAPIDFSGEEGPALLFAICRENDDTGQFREDMTSRHFFKCRLGLPVVHDRIDVVTMKSIDMYILHDSSLVVCFSNMSAYFA